MAVDLFALSFDANDPRRVAAFWAGVLGWERTDDHHDDGVALLPSDDTGFRLRFLPSQEQKPTAQNRIHFDLTSQSLEEQMSGPRRVDRHRGSRRRGHVDIADNT